MTTATVRCAQPGCDGTIQDGYCDTCGLAAPAASSGPSGPSASASSGSAGEIAGYIVMEYVGGKSLKQILVDARQAGGSVPVAHALAYAIEVLPALGYLHDRGMVYCGFKPDNVIQTEEQLKVIDLGGVRRIDSDEAIYGTVGYQAPEIEADGPSPSSDLYTVGRALAVPSFEFRGFQSTFKYSLPDGVPLLGEQESFARPLRRATADAIRPRTLT